MRLHEQVAHGVPDKALPAFMTCLLTAQTTERQAALGCALGPFPYSPILPAPSPVECRRAALFNGLDSIIVR